MEKICSHCMCMSAGVGGGIGVTPISTTNWVMGFVNNICPECKQGSLDQVWEPTTTSTLSLQPFVCLMMCEDTCWRRPPFHVSVIDHDGGCVLSMHCVIEISQSRLIEQACLGRQAVCPEVGLTTQCGCSA